MNRIFREEKNEESREGYQKWIRGKTARKGRRKRCEKRESEERMQVGRIEWGARGKRDVMNGWMDGWMNVDGWMNGEKEKEGKGTSIDSPKSYFFFLFLSFFRSPRSRPPL